jgi:superfamily II DNA or RNA helicase
LSKRIFSKQVAQRIITDELLRFGPWQEFERNTARLLLNAGWLSPRIVGRSSDGGADVLAIHPKSNEVWVFQCKHSQRRGSGKSAIDEVRAAGKAYGADRLCIVTSQPPPKPFMEEVARLRAAGLPIETLGPIELMRIAEKVPEFAPGAHELRDYQQEAVEIIRNNLLEQRRALMVLATGLGKTTIASEVIVDLLRDDLLPNKRVLVLAHTLPLVNQLLTSLWSRLPSSVATHRFAEGERPSGDDGVTVATFQSMINDSDQTPYDLVFVDEAHHVGAPGYSQVIDKYSGALLLAATATPWRTDGCNISQWFGSPVFSMDIKQGLSRGFLSDVDYRIFLDHVDWDAVRGVSKYGYSIRDLNKKLLIPVRDAEAIRKIQDVQKGNLSPRILVFSPSQAHAATFASLLRRHGFKAKSLTHDLSHIERFRTLADFASGKIDTICAVDLLNEGIDVPEVDLLVFMRVTHSRRIFIQQLGRGLRLKPQGGKVVVLDFAADVRRIHAAFDLANRPDGKPIEIVPLSSANVGFRDVSMGSFFHEWIADLGDLSNQDENHVVNLPILDPTMFNYPDDK